MESYEDVCQIFNISARGFLPQDDPKKVLPEYYKPWEDIVKNLDDKDQLYERINSLKQLDLCHLSDQGDYERAYTILCLISHAYVWSGNPKTHLPSQLSVPWWHVSQKLGIVPVLTHAAVDMYNWYRVDPSLPIELDNLKCINTITKTQDEEWFYLIMTDIEAKGGELLYAMIKIMNLVNSIEEKSTEEKANVLIEVKLLMQVIKVCLEGMSNTIIRMKEKCNPVVFFNGFRKYLSGWTDKSGFPNGLIYSNVSDEGLKFNGGSGAQSSLFQCVDAFLNVNHEDVYFNDIQQYMPKAHRDFIQYVRLNSNFYNYMIQVNDMQLDEEYINCLTNLTKFRQNHYGIVFRYIIKMIHENMKAAMTEEEALLEEQKFIKDRALSHINPDGTGDTCLREFLLKSIASTRNARALIANKILN